MGLFSSKPAAPPPDSGLFGPSPLMAPPPPPITSRFGGILKIGVVLVGVIFLTILGISFYNYLRRRQGLPELAFRGKEGSSGDKTPAPVDGKVRTVIPAGELPTSTSVDYGVQYWMYISDWDYKFGQSKQVLSRVSPTSPTTFGPRITLHPTDNALQVQVSIFPTGQTAGAATPDAGTTGDTFTCTVENVPLQRWFSVSATVFQRNMDIYINGRLVKSCVLPGVPKPAVGDMILNDADGFSGSLCNVHYYTRMLTPSDAKDFFAAGTNCRAPTPTTVDPVDKDSFFITLFGYTFRFSTLNKEGKELSSYTF